MGKGEHTPGPWEYEVHELSTGFSGIVYGPDGNRIGTDHLSEADARLIASAPELLKALRKARNTLAGLNYPKIAADICDAALSAAEGRS